MADNDNPITLRIQGEFAKQLRDMKNTIGADSEMDVIRQALSLMYYALGNEIKIEQKTKNRTLVFDQFKNKPPIS